MTVIELFSEIALLSLRSQGMHGNTSAESRETILTLEKEVETQGSKLNAFIFVLKK